MKPYKLLLLFSLLLMVGTSCSGSAASENTTETTSTSSSTVDTDKLKTDLKSRICDFLTEEEVKTILDIAALEGHVSGYEGAAAQYCSYNWNDFDQEVRFAYVFNTIGNAEMVGQSIKMFKESNLEKVTVGVTNEGAYWNSNTSRLVVFFSDVQVYVDLRKYSGSQAKEKAIQLFEKALEGY